MKTFIINGELLTYSYALTLYVEKGLTVTFLKPLLTFREKDIIFVDIANRYKRNYNQNCNL